MESPTTKTRGGAIVRIYCRDAGGRHPIHGAYWNATEDCWTPMSWDKDGCFVGKPWPRSVDLVDQE
jgi:hypothetical protein